MQIAQIENDLRIEEQQSCPGLSWLNDSYGDGLEFWRSLKNAADDLFPVKTTSALFQRYNLYYDFLLRNLNSPAPAFIFYEANSGFKNLSYRELHERALEKTALWKSLGVDEQQTVCVIRTIGVELIVELAAALQIGCRVVFLPPLGRSYLQKRLALLGPARISCAKIHLSLLSDVFREKILTEASKENKINGERGVFFTYLPGRSVYAVFDPCTEKLPIVKDIKSDAVYLGALRDGLIALGLGPGKIYAAPGFHFLETCPWFFLAGLLCGATYLHLTPQDIKENPQVTVAKKINVFGVSKTVRDILLEKPVNADGVWQTWFRNPAESADLDQWHHFSRSLNLSKSYSFNMRWNAAAGGCHLFSVRRKGSAHTGVLPSSGMNWQLAALSGTGEESLSDFGVLAVLPPGSPAGDEKITTGDMIVKKGNEWLFLGVEFLNREGRFYPADEILDVLKKAVKNVYFSLSAVPAAEPAGHVLISLLVFCGNEKKISRERILKNIREIIAEEMGDEFQPDKVELFSLYPRFTQDGEVNHEWCRAGYLTTDLRKKAKDEVYMNITRMRSFLIQKSVLANKQ
jgi:hypothetical protein